MENLWKSRSRSKRCGAKGEVGKGTSDSDSNADRSGYGSIPLYLSAKMHATNLSNTFVSNSINLYPVNILNRFEKFLTNESRDVNTFALWDEVGWVKVRHSRHSCEKTKLLKGTRIIFNMAATKETHNLKKLNL